MAWANICKSGQEHQQELRWVSFGVCCSFYVKIKKVLKNPTFFLLQTRSCPKKLALNYEFISFSAKWEVTQIFYHHLGGADKMLTRVRFGPRTLSLTHCEKSVIGFYRGKLMGVFGTGSYILDFCLFVCR